MRRFLPRLVLFAVFLWCLAQLGREVERYHHSTADPLGHGEVAKWRLGEGRPEALRDFLTPIATGVPANRVVVFASGTGSETQDFFLTYWVAYFLPRHRVIPLSHPRAQQMGQVLAAYNTELEHPRIREAKRSPSGVIYRVMPP
ncbi:MAG: hypothetical protein AAF604_01465 [Acidobacteriota bacterium]